MKRHLAALVLVLALLSGCASNPLHVPEQVLVPADASPTVDMPSCPAEITVPAAGAPASEVVRTALEIITEQRACIARLKALLAPYTAKQPTVAEPAK